MITINGTVYYVQTGTMEQNCVLVRCPETGRTALIDPGSDHDRIEKSLREISAEPALIINTHCHYDHLGEVAYFMNKYNIPFLVHENESEYSTDPEKNYSFTTGTSISVRPDGTFKDGDIIDAGTVRIMALHTPGHTFGSSCFFTGNVLISGDTVFAGNIGRTDLYGGSTDTILNSIRSKILPLDDSVIIIPGHGRHTTVGEERKFNPYFS